METWPRGAIELGKSRFRRPDDGIQPERLFKIIVEAGADGLPVSRASGDGVDDAVPLFVPDDLTQVPPAHARQVMVHKDNREQFLFHDLQGLFSAVGRLDAVAESGEDFIKQVQNQFLIINNQNFALHDSSLAEAPIQPLVAPITVRTGKWNFLLDDSFLAQALGEINEGIPDFGLEKN